MVADAIAGAEVSVGVVVESAPADSSGILRVGGKLVVDTGMADGVLGEAFDLVNRLKTIFVQH